MIRLLQGISNWKYILPLLVLFGLMSFVIFPDYQSKLRKIAGEKVRSLDVRFSYTITDVNDLFKKLGAEGRNLYKVIVGRIDMIYPIVYGFLFVLILAYLLRKIAKPNSKFIFLSMLPLLGALFDYLENFNTLNLLSRYPDITEQAVNWGEQMTRLKQVLLVSSVALILVLLVLLGIKAITNRKLKQRINELG